MTTEQKETAAVIAVVLVAALYFSQLQKSKASKENRRHFPVTQRTGGAGINPHDAGPYTVEALAIAGGLLL